MGAKIINFPKSNGNGILVIAKENGEIGSIDRIGHPDSWGHNYDILVKKVINISINRKKYNMFFIKDKGKEIWAGSLKVGNEIFAFCDVEGYYMLKFTLEYNNIN